MEALSALPDICEGDSPPKGRQITPLVFSALTSCSTNNRVADDMRRHYTNEALLYANAQVTKYSVIS